MSATPNAVIVGDIFVAENYDYTDNVGDLCIGKYPYSLLIKFADKDAIKAACATGSVTFNVLGGPAESKPVDVPALINALKYAADGIAKMAEHVDMEAVEAEGLDVQDCRDCVEFAIERAGVVV